MTPPDDPNRVLIFDTTLRDGEQSPGISLNTQEKLEIAQQLARLGVDVIEAGFPITSPGDFEAVQAIARTGGRPGHRRPGAHARGRHRRRLQRGQGRRAPARSTRSSRPRTSTSSYQLQTTREDVKGQARAAVAHAKQYLDDVEFSPMDATRADLEFTAEVCQIAIDEGATTINIPDTVGYTMPHEYAEFLRRLYEAVPDLRDVVLSVHCHDDLGLAVANSFAGLQAGARQVECAVNGIGERAGNASLEEIVMLLHTRQADVGLFTGRQHAGDRAHLAHGVAADRLRGPAQQGDRGAQRVRPRVGHPPGRRAQGAHHLRDHGRHHRRAGRQLDRAGQALGPPRAGPGAGRAGLRAARARRSTPRSSASRRSRTRRSRSPRWTSRRWSPTSCARRSPATRSSGSTSRPRPAGPPHATVGVRGPDGEELVGSFTGDGPVDAIFHAINAATRVDARLREFRVDAVTGGQDALGETSVVLEVGGVTGAGQGVSTDILEAGARAYVRALSNAVRRHGVLAEPEAADAPAPEVVRAP